MRVKFRPSIMDKPVLDDEARPFQLIAGFTSIAITLLSAVWG